MNSVRPCAPDAQAVDDYVAGVAAMGHTADYIVVNVSSPNTPGRGCDLQHYIGSTSHPPFSAQLSAICWAPESPETTLVVPTCDTSKML